MTAKILIQKIPNEKGGLGPKRWEEERGEFVQISHGEEIRHLALFQIRKGFTRGRHYHAEKEEVFYVARGRLRALWRDMDTLGQGEVILEKGDKIRIKPRCGHLFYGLEDALVVEYSPQIYDPEDSFKVDFPLPY